jgi:cell division septation protein DedD
VTLGASFKGRVLIGPVAGRFKKETAQASAESLEKLRSLVTPD